ncbi:hypothetical protein B5T_01722 [Alloalcanivorax dieselolei B5]|uniref:Uncharacterized protein n=1 Tax=Alcanivorax dieselolei (strain DSM 16502 / CGMCC 1.3690 / MCCC 1A00001 / B-5) TaxID=930169 RepID=K0CEH3_ALCDB|nr:hypothetical protein B5T_01722 [Alloalcanivorax dieselolei B5]GGJ88576.1 hypothetical protein GCM10007426_17330 [Alloalcanivorax dieselolei]
MYLVSLSDRVVYCGNPVHKRNPGDFGLSPPAGPRPGKSLCDTAAIFEKAVAGELLKEGARRGLVSRQVNNDWPQNIWAVTDDGMPLEAQLENRETGAYHGYPMPPTDPFVELVMTEWEARRP